MPGALAALLGSILPPTALMLGVVTVLHRLRREAWVSRFVEGLSPAVAVLMIFIAVKLLLAEGGPFNWPTLVLAVGSLVALLLNAPPPIVLLAAGLLGILLLR